MKQRIDQLLVARRLFESRARAQAAIAAGLVRVNGAIARKASESFDDSASIEAGQPYPWVSRGGVKLAHALDRFAIDALGRVCLDVGSSTGGFTQVLLDRGARQVGSVDAGRGQMHASLRADQRIRLFEATDIRRFAWPDDLQKASLVVVDVSFISLALVIPVLARFATEDAEVIALIKPQFEVGRDRIGRNGVVTDEAARAAAIENVKNVATRSGWAPLGVIESPIAGGDGNREFLMHARFAARPAPP